MAITRAKALLIVVGNPKILQIDHCWKRFIDYCQMNGALVGDKFHLHEMTDNDYKQLLNNRDPVKYQEVQTEKLPIDEAEILKDRVHRLPENEVPKRKMRTPVIKPKEIKSQVTINGTLETGKKIKFILIFKA